MFKKSWGLSVGPVVVIGVAIIGLAIALISGPPTAWGDSSDDSHGGGTSGTVTLHEGSDVFPAISPDHKTIVFGMQTGLWKMSAKGGKATRLGKRTGDLTRPDISPDGKRVVFQAYEDNNFHIQSMSLSGKHGSDRQTITNSKYDDRAPAYSPDGRKVAFASDRDGTYHIWVKDLETGKLSQWTKGSDSHFAPTWSPDGKRVAYIVGIDDDAQKIEATNSAGKTETLVEQNKGQVRAPSWSPNGKHLTFTLEVKGKNKLYISSAADKSVGRQLSGVREDVFGFPARWVSNKSVLYASDGKIQHRSLETGNVKTIPFTVKLRFNRDSYEYKKHELDGDKSQTVKGITSPTMSSDGNHVAFIALNDLWLMKPGDKPQRVTHDKYTELNPTWSPDGKELAYSSDRDGLERVYIRNIDTGKERRLTKKDDTENQYRATWSPNGKKIAFQTGKGVFDPPDTYVTNVESGKITKVDELSKQFEPGRPTWNTASNKLAMAALKTASERFRQGWNQIRVADLNRDTAYWVDPEKFQNISSRTSGNGPVWSPDGKKMAYVRDSVLAVMPVDNSGHPQGKPKTITTNNADYVDWVDSHHLTYMSNGELHHIKADGSGDKEIPIDLKWKTKKPSHDLTLIHAGRFWDGTGPEVENDVYVLVKGSRIAGVIPTGAGKKAKIPDVPGMKTPDSLSALKNQKGVKFVDASKQMVMPGLIEGHMHREWVPYLGSREGRQLLSYGITSVFSLGDPAYETRATKESVQSGNLVGPRAFTTAEHLNGSRIYYGFMRTTSNKTALKRELERVKALDMDALKTYVRLPNTYQREANSFAHEMGIPTFSHFFYPSLAFGQDDMSHLSATQRWAFSHTVSDGGFSYNDVLKLATASKMAITTTPFGATTLFNYGPDVLNDQRIKTLYAPWQLKDLKNSYKDATTTDQTETRRSLRQELQFLHKVQQNGGSIWAGTDQPLTHVAESLHQTIRAEVRYGGFTPYQALKTATSSPAKDMGVGDQIGTLESGKIADMMFVKGNPLENIEDIENVQQVMHNGHLTTIKQLMKPFKKNGAKNAATVGATFDSDSASVGDHVTTSAEVTNTGSKKLDKVTVTFYPVDHLKGHDGKRVFKQIHGLKPGETATVKATYTAASAGDVSQKVRANAHGKVLNDTHASNLTIKQAGSD